MLRLWLLGNWWEQDATNAEFRHEDRHQESVPQLSLRTSEAFEVRFEGTTSRALHRLGVRYPVRVSLRSVEQTRTGDRAANATVHVVDRGQHPTHVSMV
jgi:hypothetical protein